MRSLDRESAALDRCQHLDRAFAKINSRGAEGDNHRWKRSLPREIAKGRFALVANFARIPFPIIACMLLEADFIIIG